MLFSITGHATRALGIFVCALAIASCGGGNDRDPSVGTLDASGRVNAQTADGASVSYAPLDADTTPSERAPTVRVARDATGAQALPEGYAPLGAVYQYTPLGMGAAKIEIRVPFDPALAGGQAPQLLVSMPGEPWSEVADVRVEEGRVVAQVPQLMYAVVASNNTPSATPEAAKSTSDLKNTASSKSAPVPPRLSIAVASSTTPQLPAADTRGIINLTQATRLDLQLGYNLPTGCTGTPRVRAYGIYVPRTTGNSNQIKTVELANIAVNALTGNVTISQNLATSQNGAWTFAAAAYCTNPGQLLPRYAYLASGPVINVNVQATSAAPLITQAPQNASVTEGAQASFSVAATGTSLAYQWQRSNNGGTSYTNIASATAASVSLTATLADNASLWRVIVRNTSGATTSTAASLTVAQRAIAPAITSDPANQAVIEGETASFTSAASGTPAPSIQWQTRPAATTTQATWTDIPGANAATYTTSATTPSANGRQYRALFNNSAGSATTLPATLTVSARIIAPSITTQPIAQTVQAGQLGLFSITASGTSPLNYQWFKNGQALVAANATEVLIPANAADVGTSYQISVQVSNSAGTVTSAIVSMAVTTVVNTGTLVSPTQGAVVTAGAGTADQPAPTLNIPAGALASATVITFVAQSSAAVGLPSDIEPLGDVLTIGPASVVFNQPVVLSLPVPDNLPADKVIALVTLPAASSPSSSAKLSKQSPSVYVQAAINSSSLQRLAQSGKVRSGVTQMAAGAPVKVNCASTNNFSGSKFNTVIAGGVSVLAAAVPIAMCDNNTTAPAPTPPPGNIPSDTEQACTDNADFVNMNVPNVGADASLISRHVDCRSNTSGFSSNTVYVDLIDNNGSWRYATASEVNNRDPNYRSIALGTFDTIDVRTSVFGPSNSLSKKISIRMRIRNYTPDTSYPAGAPKPNSITVKPRLQCQTLGTSESNRCTFSQGDLKLALSSNAAQAGWGGNEAKEFTVNFNWVAPSNGPDVETYNVSWDISDFIATGSADRGTNSPYYFSLNNSNIKIRCDRGVAQANTQGCILPEAAPVYVLDSAPGSSVQEAAEHIREAQYGSLNSPGKFVLKANTRAVADSSVIGINALQRAKSTVVQNANRSASCTSASSLFNTRIPLNQSSSCAANLQTCSCDEYPFAATWNGGRFSPDKTSAKRINASHNGAAGGVNLSIKFFGRERVLDFTQYPDQVQPYDPSAESNRGGDDFWILIK
jgi:VCBS repeat-containing protein